MGRHIRPGVTTLELDRIAEDFIRAHGAVPAFLGYQGFPASLCISVNEQDLCHVRRSWEHRGLRASCDPNRVPPTRAQRRSRNARRAPERPPTRRLRDLRKDGPDVLTDFSIIEQAINN